MLDKPACPICGAIGWKTLGKRTFSAETKGLSDYVAARIRCLFEVWFPGHDSVELSSSMCEACGFVTNIPRASAADVDAKYRYFADKAGQSYGKSERSETQQARTRRAFGLCKPYLKSKSEILDYGGGDGRLMKDFVSAGHRCFLVDYNTSPCDYVTKLADTVDGVERKFDMIVCNHVIEHVPEPVATVKALKNLLKPDGTIHIEVPMEIWRKPPLQEEPITHVNFFVVDTVRRMLEEAGLQVISCKDESYITTTGLTLPAVRAVARLSDNPTEPSSSGVNTVKGMLNPGLPQRLKRTWVMRSLLGEKIAYKLRLRK